MPSRTKLEINSFIKGFITEASPLTFPDSAAIVDENFVLKRDGSRRRRKGMNYEDGRIIRSYTASPGVPVAASLHLWKSPQRQGDFDIIVVHVGNILKFFKTGVPVLSAVSNDILAIDGAGILPVDYVPGEILSSSYLRGQFILTYNSKSVLVFDYDEITNTISRKSITLKVRDLFGIESAYAVDERPTFVPPLGSSDVDEINHLYNLRNQGWPKTAVCTKTAKGEEVSGSATEYADPAILLSVLGEDLMASNADVMWRARTTAAESVDAINAYSKFEVLKQQYGNTPAPKGRYIIDVFDRSQSRQEHFNLIEDPSLLLPLDKSNGYISRVISYAGRFFYSIKEVSQEGGDNNSPKLSTMIFFSQVVKSDQNLGACYTEADPTSEFIFDPIATDGGFIVIAGMGEVIGFAALGYSLFVFAKNGVWEINGGEQEFSATNQKVNKVTSIGAISGSSIVTVESSILYWTEGGIYAITIDPSSLNGVASNITLNTIQTYYNNIPSSEKSKVVGAYDEKDKTVRWLHNTQENQPYTFFNELVLDVDLQAFYLNKFALDESTNKVFWMIPIPNMVYLVGSSTSIDEISYSFGFYNRDDFRDFGFDAPATLLTGYLTGGTGSTDKTVKNIVIHCARTEKQYESDGLGGYVFDNPSGVQVSTQWEWTNSASAGRWGVPFQGYRLTSPYYPIGYVGETFDYGYTVITTKTGVRGKGHALSIKFETEPDKDLHLLGWGLEVTVDDNF